ncbi:ABC transporter substrate-binding protein [Iodidimonas sp. SYSU 1G8]|uniref:ABC transporter substrate-binding protein n=1 Tax=Iodidimonas sp. SYSU 1G8 TaxID=3133967 RepID=UPI0031FECB8A
MNGLRLLLVAAAGLLAAACSEEKPAETPVSKRPTPIVFATDWRAQAEQGGFYQALATGEYAKRGLDVTILQGGPSVNVPQLLASGAVQMGMGSNSFIILNLASEKVPVTAVAAFMQKDPQVLMAHPGQGINSLADMKGRPILLGDASITAFWVWLKAKYGFTDDQVRKYTFNPGPFLADPKAIQQGYVTSEPYTIEQQGGFKPEVFLLADEGYPGYAAMVLAPDSLIASDPDAVRAFVEGSAAGWRSYLNGDPEPGDALILKDNPEMTPALLAQAREKMKAYGIVESGGAEIGAMTDARWEEFFRMASQQGVYAKDLDFRKAYSLDFLKPAAP